MKKVLKIIAITLIIMGVITMMSCGATKGGCYGTRGYVGYGH